MIKCYTTFVLQFVIFLIRFSMGFDLYGQSQKFIDEGGEYNELFIKGLLPYIKWALIIMRFGRIIIILISLRKSSIYRCLIYYYMVEEILVSFLPVDYGQVHTSLVVQKNFSMFGLLYSNFWPNCIAMLGVQAL